MFVPHSKFFNLIKIWLFDVASLILVSGVLVAVVVKEWRFLRDFLKTKDDPKPKAKVEQEAAK